MGNCKLLDVSHRASLRRLGKPTMKVELKDKDVSHRKCRCTGWSALCYSPPMPAKPGKPGNGETQPKPVMYCPACAVEVTDPLVCGDCSAVICRVCGTPLESPDELGIG